MNKEVKKTNKLSTKKKAIIVAVSIIVASIVAVGTVVGIQQYKKKQNKLPSGNVLEVINKTKEKRQTFSKDFEYEIKNKEVTIKGLKEDAENKNVLVIPKNIEGFPVTKISENAFANNVFIEAVYCSDSLQIISRNAFENCLNLSIINFGNGVQKIEDFAFKGCLKLSLVSISNSTKSIGKEAFGLTQISSVFIPNSVEVLGSLAFPDNTLISFEKNEYAKHWCKQNNYQYKELPI